MKFFNTVYYRPMILSTFCFDMIPVPLQQFRFSDSQTVSRTKKYYCNQQRMHFWPSYIKNLKICGRCLVFSSMVTIIILFMSTILQANFLYQKIHVIRACFKCTLLCKYANESGQREWPTYSPSLVKELVYQLYRHTLCLLTYIVHMGIALGTCFTHSPMSQELGGVLGLVEGCKQFYTCLCVFCIFKKHNLNLQSESMQVLKCAISVQNTCVYLKPIIIILYFLHLRC